MFRAFNASSACWRKRRAVSYCDRPSVLSAPAFTLDRSRAARPIRSRIALTVCASDPGVGVSVNDGGGVGRATDSTGSAAFAGGSGRCSGRAGRGVGFEGATGSAVGATVNGSGSGYAATTRGGGGGGSSIGSSTSLSTCAFAAHATSKSFSITTHSARISIIVVRLRSGIVRVRRHSARAAWSAGRRFSQQNRFYRNWEHDDEGRAYPDCGFDVDLAVVNLDRAIHHRQPDAGAALLGRVIQLENLGQILRRDSDPCIFDAHANSAVCRRRA